MFNLNSPIVQKMLQETPPPNGNFQYGYGSPPTVETVMTRSPDPTSASDPRQVVARTTEGPFPSPKEMVMNAGMQQQAMNPMMSVAPPAPGVIPMGSGMYGYGYSYPMYPATTYVPGGSMVGGVPNVLQGYYNPYMGYGTYMGYGMQQDMPSQWQLQYMTPDQVAIYKTAVANGLTYKQQLQMTSDVMQALSFSVSAYYKEDDEKAEKRASFYRVRMLEGDPTGKSTEEVIEEREKNARWNQPDAHMVVKIVKGDDVICEGTAHDAHKQHMKSQASRMWETSNVDFARLIANWNQALQAWVAWRNSCYDNAIERQYDHCDGGLPGFFNTGMVAISRQMWQEENRRWMTHFSVRGQYDPEKFMRDIMKSSEVTPEQQMYITRFATRKRGLIQGTEDGIMPTGTPVQPGTDPRVASAFYMDPVTGEFSVRAPDFKRDQKMSEIDMARERFLEELRHPKQTHRLY